MLVEIRLYATLRRYVPAAGAGVFSMEVQEGSTALEVLKIMSIDLTEVHIIMVNGVNKSMNVALNNGDRLGLFPAVGGG